MPRRDIKVTNFDYLPDDAEKRFAIVKDALHRGGYVVAFASNPGMSRVVQLLFPAESLKQWDIPQSNGQPYITLYRLKWNAQAANRADDAGRVQLGRVEPQGDRGEAIRTIE
jgi:hypothetical protein